MVAPARCNVQPTLLSDRLIETPIDAAQKVVCGQHGFYGATGRPSPPTATGWSHHSGAPHGRGETKEQPGMSGIFQQARTVLTLCTDARFSAALAVSEWWLRDGRADPETEIGRCCPEPASISSIGRFRQDQTFSGAELNDQFWSGAAALPFRPGDQDADVGSPTFAGVVSAVRSSRLGAAFWCQNRSVVTPTGHPSFSRGHRRISFNTYAKRGSRCSNHSARSSPRWRSAGWRS